MDRIANKLDNLAPPSVVAVERVTGLSSEESRSLWWYVQDTGHWQCKPEYRVASRTYHGHLIMFMVRGSGHGEYRNQPWKAKKGDAVLMDLRHRHAYHAQEANPWEMFWVIFDGPGVSQTFASLLQSAGSPVIPFASEKRMRDDFAVIFHLLKNPKPAHEAWVWHHLTGLVANIVERLRETRDWTDPAILAAHEGIAGALSFLQREYHRVVTLQELAREAHMSVCHFARRFRETTGFTPMEYLEKYRMRRAKELLVNRPEMRLHEIGHAVGYEDPAYFSRVFRKQADVSARDYRRSLGVGTGFIPSARPGGRDQ